MSFKVVEIEIEIEIEVETRQDGAATRRARVNNSVFCVILLYCKVINVDEIILFIQQGTVGVLMRQAACLDGRCKIVIIYVSNMEEHARS